MKLRLPLSWVEWLGAHRVLRRPYFLACEVPEAPATLAPRVLYHEVRDGYPKWAHLTCPHCGEHIQLQTAQARQRWTLSVDWLNRPTVSPSIWETQGCGAHFFVRRGKLVWADGERR
ncbi:DUF6527 family protein [Mesorhizobium sp. M0496]|uniref:DUF6527 family protein n=1 Tax=Mesorhizobium sp. M0496 TaxID=2956952 RepID=UPI000A072A0C